MVYNSAGQTDTYWSCGESSNITRDEITFGIHPLTKSPTNYKPTRPRSTISQTFLFCPDLIKLGKELWKNLTGEPIMRE